MRLLDELEKIDCPCPTITSRVREMRADAVLRLFARYRRGTYEPSDDPYRYRDGDVLPGGTDRSVTELDS